MECNILMILQKQMYGLLKIPKIYLNLNIQIIKENYSICLVLDKHLIRQHLVELWHIIIMTNICQNNLCYQMICQNQKNLLETILENLQLSQHIYYKVEVYLQQIMFHKFLMYIKSKNKLKERNMIKWLFKNIYNLK